MRYAQRGEYTPAEQQWRERVRLQAAERFACGDGISEIAHDLRVMPGSVRRRQAWQDGGTAALRSKRAGVAGESEPAGAGLARARTAERAAGARVRR
jgi:hypothetical protein